jgi:hypothetical protein
MGKKSTTRLTRFQDFAIQLRSAYPSRSVKFKNNDAILLADLAEWSARELPSLLD